MNIHQKLNIKSTALFLAVLMFVCSLSACQDKNKDKPKESSINTTSETTVFITTDKQTETVTSPTDTISISETQNDETDITFNSDSKISSSAAISDISTTLSDITSDNPTTTSASISSSISSISTTISQNYTTTQINTTTAVKTVASQTTTAKQPAQIVIPTIYSVSSPGSSVIKGDKGSIDYSNSSKGYFSAVYTGKASVVKLRVECTGASKYDHDIAADGKSHYFPLHNGSGKYTIGLYEQVGTSFVQVCSGSFEAKVTSDIDMYLYPNNYVEFNQNSNVVQKVAEITAGMTSDLDKTSAIFKYVTSNVTYNKQFAADVKSGKIKTHVPNPDATLKSKTGICYDYASLFAAMARAEGIPARLVVGYASPDIYHAWNEVYTTETGWITVEYYLSKKGFNRVDATFYSSATDKANVSEFISKNSNYSSLYIY